MREKSGKQRGRQATEKRRPQTAERGPKEFTTVGVRFAHGPNVSRVFTYKVRVPHPYRPGDAVVVDSRVGMSLAFVVKVDARPRLDGMLTYRWLRHRVVELHADPIDERGVDRWEEGR